MWLLVMFDVPSSSSEDKKAYNHLRKTLVKSGFIRLQFSVYARFFKTEILSQTHANYIKNAIPEEGHVRLLVVTERQFEKMEVYFGNNKKISEKRPTQLMLF